MVVQRTVEGVREECLSDLSQASIIVAVAIAVAVAVERSQPAVSGAEEQWSGDGWEQAVCAVV